jgi:hypothetical protein
LAFTLSSFFGTILRADRVAGLTAKNQNAAIFIPKTTRLANTCRPAHLGPKRRI